MSLINCPECGKEISDKADSCPNCGCPINTAQIEYDKEYEEEKTDAKKSQSIFGIVGFVISIIAMFFGINGFVLWIISLILCIIGCLKKDKKHGFAIVGNIISFIMLLCILIIFIGTSGVETTGRNSKSGTQENVKESENGSAENASVNMKDSKGEKDIDDSKQYINITSTELIDSYNENQVKCKQNYDGKLLNVTGEVNSVGTDIVGNTYVCLGHDTEYTFVGIQCYAKDNDTINQIAELKEGDLITVSGKGECGSLSFSLKNTQILEIVEKVEDSYVDENGEKIENITTGQSNALKQAKSYLDFSAFSYQGLIEQLEYEKYSHEDAVFAADNCGADWNEQAAKKAKSYLSFSSFSKDGLIEQLEYEGFTHEQAVYGAEQNGY